MAVLTIEVSEDEASQLKQVAQSRGMTDVEMAQRWVRERLVHERERAEGGGRPMSPRARREEQ
jgi:hypothetical protein